MNKFGVRVHSNNEQVLNEKLPHSMFSIVFFSFKKSFKNIREYTGQNQFQCY